MRSITVAELRQNPTDALNAVESGETYVVTRHRREIARLVPTDQVDVVPPKKTGPASLSARPRHRLRSAGTIAELLADMESAW